MKTKAKVTKATVGLIGLGVALIAGIALMIALSIQYGFTTVLGWFISPQALLVYLIIFVVAVIAVPIIILAKVNKRF